MVGQAPWFPAPTFWVLVQQAIIPWHNKTNMVPYNEILALIDVEFSWIATLEMDSYFIPASIQPSMEDRLFNTSNQIIRKMWMDFIARMCEEFAEIEDKGYSYVVVDTLESDLKKCFQNVPNVTHRVAIFNVIDLYMGEFALLEDAF